MRSRFPTVRAEAYMFQPFSKSTSRREKPSVGEMGIVSDQKLLDSDVLFRNAAVLLNRELL